MKNKITSIFLAGLLIIIAFFNIIKSDKSFSNKENRYLQKFPSINSKDIMSSKFGNDFEKYSTDQFIGRNTWISLKTIFDLSMLKKDNTRVYFGKDNYLFNIDSEIDQLQYDKNINYFNSFLDSISNNHPSIDLYALLVPSKSETLSHKLPSYASTINEEEIVCMIKNSLNDNIAILSLVDFFKEKRDEYIYYRTDHHWTSKGAFYAYKYFLEEKGMTPLLEDAFNVENVSKDFLGTNYRKTNYYSGNPDNIDVYNLKDKLDLNIILNEKDKLNSLYDESYLDKTDKYSYFLGGDSPILEIENSHGNNKTILIIKDSYANSFVPFLTNHYGKIIVIDPRYFNIKILDYINKNPIDEVLFLFNIQNFIQEKSLNILN